MERLISELSRMNMFASNDLDEDTEASKSARKMGLKYRGWGQWLDPKTGDVVARTVDGKLKKIDNDHKVEKTPPGSQVKQDDRPYEDQQENIGSEGDSEPAINQEIGDPQEYLQKLYSGYLNDARSNIDDESEINSLVSKIRSSPFGDINAQYLRDNNFNEARFKSLCDTIYSGVKEVSKELSNRHKNLIKHLLTDKKIKMISKYSGGE